MRGLANILILDFQPPRPWCDNLLLFVATQLMALCYSSPRKLIQVLFLPCFITERFRWALESDTGYLNRSGGNFKWRRLTRCNWCPRDWHKAFEMANYFYNNNNKPRRPESIFFHLVEQIFTILVPSILPSWFSIIIKCTGILIISHFHRTLHCPLYERHHAYRTWHDAHNILGRKMNAR